MKSRNLSSGESLLDDDSRFIVTIKDRESWALLSDVVVVCVKEGFTTRKHLKSYLGKDDENVDFEINSQLLSKMISEYIHRNGKP